MKEVKAFQTDDGSLFLTEQECILHELKVCANKELLDLWIGDDIRGFIIDNADAIHRILTPLVIINKE